MLIHLLPVHYRHIKEFIINRCACILSDVSVVHGIFRSFVKQVSHRDRDTVLLRREPAETVFINQFKN